MIKNAAKTEDIIKHLQAKNFVVERRSLYSNIDLLNYYFMSDDIQLLNSEFKRQDKDCNYITNDNRKNGYAIPTRDFTLEELQIMIDGVQSSILITQKRADTITRKIGLLASKHQRVMLNRENNFATKMRTINENAYKYAGIIQKAINDDRMIEFYFIKYNSKGKGKPVCNKKPFTVSPFALEWHEQGYFMLCIHKNTIRYFAVDKIHDLQILIDDERKGKDIIEKSFLQRKSIKLFSMRYDKIERVKLRFQNDLKSVVLECFGYGAEPMKEDDTHLSIYTYVDITPKFFGWLCSYGKSVAVVEPEHVVNKFGEYVSSISQMYKIEKSYRDLQHSSKSI
jgi:predicted DNA-binding transcriptional regulator YafY